MRPLVQIASSYFRLLVIFMSTIRAFKEVVESLWGIF